MWLLKFFNRKRWWKHPRITYFNPVIVNCNTYRSMNIIVIAMTQSIDKCLAQCLLRNFQCLHPADTYNFPSKIQMLETKRHPIVQQVKEVSPNLTIVYKFVLIRPLKTSHPQQKLWIISAFLRKQHNCGLRNFTIVKQIEFIQQRHNRITLCRSIQPTASDTQTNCIPDSDFI